MIKVNVVRKLPVNLKPSEISKVYEKGHKLILSFNKDTVLGDVSALSRVVNGDLIALGDCVDSVCITFKKAFKVVDKKVVICGGESLLVERFVNEDGYSLGVIKPCIEECVDYELEYDMYGIGETYKLADNVEEVTFEDCSLSGKGCMYNCLENKVHGLNVAVSSGYLEADYREKEVLRFFVDTVDESEDVKLLVDMGDGFATCIKSSSVIDMISHIEKILNFHRVVYLEDLE